VKLTSEFDGYRLPKDVPWPPKTIPNDFWSFAKQLVAKATGGKLVWLRDNDDLATLTVAYTTSGGKLYAPRFWPSNHIFFLREDGTAYSQDRDFSTPDFTIHWIPVDEGEQTYMFMKNYDRYNQKIG
jgi:hypothetical protein